MNWGEGFLCSSESARRILVQFWIGEKDSYAVLNLREEFLCSFELGRRILMQLWICKQTCSESASSDLLCSTGMCKQRLVLNVQSMKLRGTIVEEKSLHAPRAAERRVLTIDSSRQCIVNDNEARVVLKHLIHHLLSLIPIHNINLDSLDRELCISPGSTTSCYRFGNQLKTCCYGCFCHRLTHLPCAAIPLIHLVSKAFSHEEHQQPSAITTQCSKPRSSKPRPRKPRSSLNPSKTPVLNPTNTSKAKGMYHDWYSGAEEAGARITAAIRGRSSGAQAVSHRLFLLLLLLLLLLVVQHQARKKPSASPPWTRLACLAPRRRSRQRRSCLCGGGKAWVAKARVATVGRRRRIQAPTCRHWSPNHHKQKTQTLQTSKPTKP